MEFRKVATGILGIPKRNNSSKDAGESKMVPKLNQAGSLALGAVEENSVRPTLTDNLSLHGLKILQEDIPTDEWYLRSNRQRQLVRDGVPEGVALVERIRTQIHLVSRHKRWSLRKCFHDATMDLVVLTTSPLFLGAPQFESQSSSC